MQNNHSLNLTTSNFTNISKIPSRLHPVIYSILNQIYRALFSIQCHSHLLNLFFQIFYWHLPDLCLYLDLIEGCMMQKEVRTGNSS